VAHVLSHRVRYHEADAQGFLFNGRYLEIADVAMSEFFRYLGFPYLDMVAGGMDPSVVSVELAFRRPARFDDVVDVNVVVAAVGRSSFQLAMLMTREGETIAEGHLVYVNVGAKTASSRPIPGHIAAALEGEMVSAMR
jgi:acyl-CoA thioester hydrolase